MTLAHARFAFDLPAASASTATGGSARGSQAAGSGRVILRAESVVPDEGTTYSLPQMLTLG